MKRIDLGDIGNLAEAIAAIGVIVSLIFSAYRSSRIRMPYGLPAIKV